MAKIYVFCLTLLIFTPLHVAAEEEGGNEGALRIESRAELLTADYYINGGDEEQDRRRTRLGMGERAKLTVSGKKMGNPDEVTWKVIAGQEYIEELGEGCSGESITITVSDQNFQGGNVIITATAGDEETTAIMELETVVPESLKGLEPIDITTPVPALLYVSMLIQTKISPTDVNFTKLQFIERDSGSAPENHPLDEGGHTAHGANSMFKVSNTHTSNKYDRVGGGEFVDTLAKTRLPTAWEWICTFYTHTGAGGAGSEADDHVRVCDERQRFEYSIKNDPQEGEVYSLTISKYGVSLSKSISTQNN